MQRLLRSDEQPPCMVTPGFNMVLSATRCEAMPVGLDHGVGHVDALHLPPARCFKTWDRRQRCMSRTGPPRSAQNCAERVAHAPRGHSKVSTVKGFLQCNGLPICWQSLALLGLSIVLAEEVLKLRVANA
eukprot:2188422-Amphidinium_carterae.1